jgi:hypothetical protein
MPTINHQLPKPSTIIIIEEPIALLLLSWAWHLERHKIRVRYYVRINLAASLGLAPEGLRL